MVLNLLYYESGFFVNQNYLHTLVTVYGFELCVQLEIVFFPKKDVKRYSTASIQ